MTFSCTSFSFAYQEPDFTGVSSFVSPFLDLTYSPVAPYDRKSSLNRPQAPPHNTNHPTHIYPSITPFQTQVGAPCDADILNYSLTESTISKQGNDSIKSSSQTATFNSCPPPASSTGPSTFTYDPASFVSYGPHDMAPWYSGMTYNFSGGLSPYLQGAGYPQQWSIPPFSATATSMGSSMFQSTPEPHQLSSHFTPPSFSFAPPDPSPAFMYPSFPTIMQPPLCPTPVAHPHPQSGLLSASEQSSTMLPNHQPACPLPNPSQPHLPSPPSTNCSSGPQRRLQEARRERLAQRTSTYTGDRRPTSPSLLRYRRPQKKQPAATFEPDVKNLQTRCRVAGVDEQAILLIKRVFVDEVKLSSLTRKLSSKELASHQFGSESGQVYVCFLRAERDARYTCKLCPRNADMSWKHRRDVLRHLRREHFGLADKCNHWCVSSR
jgi:hypothetical protein